MARCTACGALPSEECDAKVHWVHDYVRVEFTDQSRRHRTFTFIKPPRAVAMAEAQKILDKSDKRSV